jgi:ATP-dependent helicase HrpA
VTTPSPDFAELLAGVTIRDRHRLRRRLERGAGRRSGPGDMAEIHRAIGEAEQRRAARAAAVPAVTYPDDLPVSHRRTDIMAALHEHQVVVVAGETGSGKTTQIPKMCLEMGRGVDGMIGHTQPRRIAARTVAERLSEELGAPLGEAVGYAVRFTDTVGERTLVKVMTDGILLAELRHDRLLTAYDTVIVDEAHERSLNIDFLLGYLTRLLPERPDLKVVVTSATIDTGRFAAHLHAPVVEVSGRTYPVEIRYRPLGPAAAAGDDDGEPEALAEERDVNQAITDAVSELAGEGPGDVLVFLPGERDIRDAADALRHGGPSDLDILPLYARLSSAEQHRVFRPHRGRRVVLATNVAETSLTVPGIRYVVDTGLARMSRFSRRTKVQRLPIERVSRASADQRAGRCGRTGPGICIRLYSRDDYEARAAFTDPEILRTNLASVILQMAAIGLGPMEDFPFIEPPDRRSVGDGHAILEELGALRRAGDEWRLTGVGRRLAQLPLDPRLGRMVLEAERRACLREVTVIAAALSIQDPRERPADSLANAQEMHRRFAVEDSDFLAYLKLWEYVTGLQAELSGNQFRKRCRREFLNPLRIREWQDVAGQIRQAYRSQGGHANPEPAPAGEIHRALLAGLLAQVGRRDRTRGDYQGARNSRWLISRDSALSRRQPAWAVAGGLVETERTWARTVARIEPAWAEQAGAHVVKRSYSAEWWDCRRGEAMTAERVTLYGLPLVDDRPVSLSRVNPSAARRMFIQRALVEGDWPVEPAFIETNRRRVNQVLALQERVRRRDLLAGDEAVYDFYDSRVPGEVTNGRRFQRWWREAARRQPGALDVPFRVLVDPTAGPVDLYAYPDRWVQGDLDLEVRYRFEPGATDDGVTVGVPLAALNRLRQVDFDWHVPGYRREIVTTLVRSLPKDLRRHFLPAAGAVDSVLASCGPAHGPLFDTVASRLARMSGEPVSPRLWDRKTLPDHLRMAFEVVDEAGRVRGRSRDLEELQHHLAGEVRAAIARTAPDLERHGVVSWTFGDLPRQVVRGHVRGYPSVVDEGDSVGVAVLDTPEAQASRMWDGTRRLLLLAAPLPANHLQRRLTNQTKLALARSTIAAPDLLDDCAAAVADDIILRHGGPSFEAAGFHTMAADAREEMVDRVARLAAEAGGVMVAAGEVEAAAGRLEQGDRHQWLAPALEDVRSQLDRLVHPGFVTGAGPGRLGDIHRYLEAAGRRLERLPGDVGRDRQRQAVIERVQARYEALVDVVVAGSAPAGAAARLGEVRWMIEELRVSLWAQALGTRAPVSEARIMRALEGLAA